MVETIDYGALVRMLHGAAAEIRSNEAELGRLDSFGGDGDHGTTMVRAMGQLEGAIAAHATDDVSAMLHEVGWAIMGVDGGATGPLFGSFFMAMAEAVPETGALDADHLARMFESGLAGVRKNTRADLGDKTILDALIPAVRALVDAEGDADVERMLAAGAAAAAEGAAATAQMAARFGRAKNIGERSKGTPDPGATSISLLFKGFHAGVQTNG